MDNQRESVIALTPSVSQFEQCIDRCLMLCCGVSAERKHDPVFLG
jgi:hypothetical protein